LKDEGGFLNELTSKAQGFETHLIDLEMFLLEPCQSLGDTGLTEDLTVAVTVDQEITLELLELGDETGETQHSCFTH
jgi:hypothetical protein